jgi:sarcosine oxidase, subunit beta
VPRIVVAGMGAIGASIAYHLALAGARDVVLCDRAHLGSGATSKGMGGIRQQFSTAAEVALARESIAFFEALGEPYFEQVGYLFLATTRAGADELEERRALQAALGVPAERVDPSFVRGLRTADVLAAVVCRTDGVGSPLDVARELVRRARELGVDVRERTPAEELDADVLVIACGVWSPELAARHGVELPIRPLCRQLLATQPLELAQDLPMTIEAETGFHFRRRGDRLVLAMHDPEPRWTWETRVDETLFADRLARLAYRYPAAASARIEDAWAGLYDMTPDAHPIIGRIADGVYVAAGFSGHGFMQSPAVGRAVAELVLHGRSSLDLEPYALARFEGGATAREMSVL